MSKAMKMKVEWQLINTKLLGNLEKQMNNKNSATSKDRDKKGFKALLRLS